MTRLQLVAAALFLANAAGYAILGPQFVLLGWALNIPCGLTHYFVVERPHNSGSAMGTAVICAIPWAQTLLTSIVFGLGVPIMVWHALVYWVTGRQTR